MKYKCLIVDDEPIARKIIKDYVADISDLKVIGEVSNPIEVANFIENTPVDILFLDINMPKLSGVQILKNCNYSA